MPTLLSYLQYVHNVESRDGSEMILEGSLTYEAVDFVAGLRLMKMSPQVLANAAVQEQIRDRLTALVAYVVNSPAVGPEERKVFMERVRKDLNATN
ncbi:MAG: hypothetical protein ACRYGG_22765 [Janthinobacterium lividum]